MNYLGLMFIGSQEFIDFKNWVPRKKSLGNTGLAGAPSTCTFHFALSFLNTVNSGILLFSHNVFCLKVT